MLPRRRESACRLTVVSVASMAVNRDLLIVVIWEQVGVDVDLTGLAKSPAMIMAILKYIMVG